MDLYTTAALKVLIDGAVKPATFLRDRYAPTGAMDIFETEKVLAEIRDGDKRIAPFVTEYANGVAVSRIGASMRELEPPKVAAKRVLTIDDINRRGFGEAVLSEKSPEERAALLVTQDMVDLSDMISRREEWMVSEMLLTGGYICKAIDDEPERPEDLELRFYDGSENPATYACGVDWDEPTAKPIDDLGAMVEVYEEGGHEASDFVCAPDVARAFLANAQVKEALDNRRYEWGVSSPTKLGPSAAIVAVVNVYGTPINVISYGAKYTGLDGKAAPYIPDGHGFLTAPASLRTMYGAVTQVEADEQIHTTSGSRVPKYTADVEGDVRTIKLSSRPLVVPNYLNPAISAELIGE